MGIILYMITYILDPICMLVNFFVVLWKNVKTRGFFKTIGGYFLSDAVSRDEFANYNYRTLWNTFLRTSNGYKFGRKDETISSALGKNQRDKTLSWFGIFICFILDKLNKEHCKNSIAEI